MRVIIYGLGLLSTLFIGRSALEMYVWTPVRGSQMVFFSLLHRWPSRAVYTVADHVRQAWQLTCA